MSQSSLPLTDQVFEQLEAAIIKGDLPQGSKISEPELAKAYGISRGTLREALSRLEERHLLLRSPNLGARVTTLSLEELVNIYQIREVLGGLSCSLAAQHMTDTEIQTLRALLDEQEKSLEAGQGLFCNQPNREFDFHYQILQGNRNPKVLTVLEGGLYQQIRMYRYQFSASSQRPYQALKEHRRIVDAIEERDAELADLLMRRHIRTARESIEAQHQNAMAQNKQRDSQSILSREATEKV